MKKRAKKCIIIKACWFDALWSDKCCSLCSLIFLTLLSLPWAIRKRSVTPVYICEPYGFLQSFFFLSFRSVFLCVLLPISCVQIEKFSSFTLYIAIWPHSLNAWSMILCRDESYSWLCSKRLKAKSIVALRFHLLFDVLLTLILVQVDFIAHLHLWVRCKLIFWLFVSFNKPLYLFYWLLSVWISTKRAKSSQQQRK